MNPNDQEIAQLREKLDLEDGTLGKARIDAPLRLCALLCERDAPWVGCVAQVRRVGEAEAFPALPVWDEAQSIVTLEADDLKLRLFLQPSGETTQLFAPDDDPRTSPLLQTPTYTLWPGAWMRLMSQPDSL